MKHHRKNSRKKSKLKVKLDFNLKRALFGDFEAQVAIEFLMTYGWMIMAAMLATGALAYFGVFDPQKFLPDKCIIEAGIACMDFKVETNRVVLILKNGFGDDLSVSNLTVEGCNCSITGTMFSDEQKTFILPGCNNAANSKVSRAISFKYNREGSLEHIKIGTINARVEQSSGTTTCEESGGIIPPPPPPPPPPPSSPLNEQSSQSTANTNSSLPSDWHGAKGSNDNIVLKLINNVAYDIYLKNFTLSWNDTSNKFKHFQHLTEANDWDKEKIYGDVDLASPITGVFDDEGSAYENLRIPANQYTIVDDLHFKNNLKKPTNFNLTLNFNDSSSSTLRFTIK